MTAICVSVLFFCVLFFLFRRIIFSYCGAVVYKVFQKSVSSSEGKISVVEVDRQEERNKNLLFLNVNKHYKEGFMLNARMIGQNFDLNARKNMKYSTPSPFQDLKGNNGLA